MATTFTSQIYQVKFNNSPAVLKILNDKGKKFEARGAIVLRCFNGNAAVRLLDADEGAHLLEYIDGQNLKNLVARGNDNQATEIICDVVSDLHSYSGAIPKELISMERNFQALFMKAQTSPGDSIYAAGARVAFQLIESEQERKVLHGDIHHENVMESSKRGWLVIDPQCLAGKRTYDVANTFYNPDGFIGFAESPEVIQRRSEIFSNRLKMDRKRILEFAFAYGCLSACWCIEDGQNPEATLRIAHNIRQLLTSLN